MNVPRGRFVKLSLLGWLGFLAVDLVVHAALLTGWYERGGPALLPLEAAFARIPLGYLSFLLLVVLVVWLAVRLGLHGAAQGLGFGIAVGALLASSHALGLISITTVDPVLAAWWSVAEVVELGVVGAIVGGGLASERLGRITAIVVAGAVAALLITIAVQSLAS